MDKSPGWTESVCGRLVTAAMTIEGRAIEDNPRGGPCHNVPLGTLVLRAGLMPQDRIETALHDAVSAGRRLGEVLVDRGLEERQLTRLLAAQHAQPFVDLTRYPVDHAAARLLPASVAQTYCALPIAEAEDAVLVAVPDPEDERQNERLRHALQRNVRLVAATRSDIKQAIGTLERPVERSPYRSEMTFDVVVTLLNGDSARIAEECTREDADAIAERIAARAQIGAMIDTRSGTVDGADVVSVEILDGVAR